jgi:protein-S-isoprenylcysteine O-methyltransferase Ste14
MDTQSISEQIKSILALPFTVLVIIPVLIVYLFPELMLTPFDDINKTAVNILGVLLALAGAFLFIHSIIIIVKIGRGTLAPWNPAKKLVVVGIYRHMRNPMILGVIFILLAESIFVGSTAILIWAIVFYLANHLYFIYKEEPDLQKRFGNEYREYVKNVPRWIPKLKGWNSQSK